jgi:hypothetical protein
LKIMAAWFGWRATGKLGRIQTRREDSVARRFCDGLRSYVSA